MEIWFLIQMSSLEKMHNLQQGESQNPKVEVRIKIFWKQVP